MILPVFFACSFVSALMIFASKSAVAPSPSPAIFLCQCLIYIMKGLFESFIFPCSICDFFISRGTVRQSSTVSFVDVSPSTEIILYVSCTSSLSAAWRAFLEIFASVVINASMVHMFGWIMPDPFRHTADRYKRIADLHRDRRFFFRVSVVMIACAACVPASVPVFSIMPVPGSQLLHNP